MKFFIAIVGLSAFILTLNAHEIGTRKLQKTISQYTFDQWTTEEGLPQSSINSIIQANDGYIWMGTQEGLVRFDGVRFTVFDKSNTPAISNNYISALYNDKKGRLWIGTYDGALIVYDDKTFRVIDSIKIAENSDIRSIYQDRAGCVWIAIRGRGVLCIDGNKRFVFDTSNGLVNNEAWTLSEDVSGRIWIGTEDGISIIENGSLRSFTTKNGLMSNNVNAICAGDNNTMWIGTNLGVMNVPMDLSLKRLYKKYTVDDGLPNRIVYSVCVDPTGLVWIGTRSGAALINGDVISTLTQKNGLLHDEVSVVFVDRENHVWLGTDGGGVTVLRDGIFSSFTTKHGLASDIVWTVYEDADQRMWIGTNKGLTVLSHDRSTVLGRYAEKNGLHDNEVYSVTVDQNGVAWVATVNGLNIIENGKVRDVAPVKKTRDMIAGCVFTDSKNRVWVATTGNGLLLFENKNLLKSFTTAQGMASNYINAVTEDRSGNIWVGTDGEGISVINDSGIITYSEKNGLPGNFIQTILVDSNNIVWIGTLGGGLARWKNGRFASITTKQGLFNDALFQILEDNFGRMWFTSNKGIFHIDKTELENCLDGFIPSVFSHTYGKEDGLQNTECNGGVQPAGWKAHDGTLWFPMSSGAATVHPTVIHTNQQPPLVVFEELVVDNESIFNQSEGIIPPGGQRYEFRFTGVSFANPSRITFKIKLEGYDKTWIDVGTRRFASYTHLPPGIYVFKVLAANSDGIWSKQEASLVFILQAKYYETLEFLIGIALMVFIALYGGYRYRIRSIRKRSNTLEQLIQKRTEDLSNAREETEQLLEESKRQKIVAEKANEMKTQMLDMAAHDLKTPLVSVSVFIKELLNMKPLAELAREDLLLIQKSTERMISLINDLLSISSIESGQLHLRKELVNLVDLAGMTVDGLRLLAERKQQMLYYIPSAMTECNVVADSSRIQDVIENIITNAIKYSPTGSEIVVSVEKEHDVVRFWVKDNGPGISAEDQQRLFKKFQILSSKPTANENATGLGLAIVKEIVLAHGGKVFVETELGKGSRFVVELTAA